MTNRMSRFPALFVSHGAPTLLIDPGPTRDFLARIGADIGRPRAILVISAHWETDLPAVSTAPVPETIHDFYGFPEALYRLRYPAAGAPYLADRVQAILRDAGFPASVDERRGLDHGAWAPLMLMYPAADIPVTQLSVVAGLKAAEAAAYHWRIGEALRPLRDEGVLILGSGSVTHNLLALSFHDPAAPVPAWTSEFNDWLALQLETGGHAALKDYRRQAPYAIHNHPTEEHLLPLLVAAGTTFDGESARRLHAAYQFGALGMDAWQFGS